MTDECRSCGEPRLVCLRCGLCEDCHDHPIEIEPAAALPRDPDFTGELSSAEYVKLGWDSSHDA